MTRRAQRLALAGLLAAAVALAANGSALLPLWEPPGEVRAVLQAQAWAGSPRPLPAVAGEGAPAPIPRALLAAGLRLAGLQDTVFLARPRAGPARREASAWLHGRDEVFPFLGPARSLHLLRLLPVAAHALAVAAAFLLARRLLPGRPGVALLSASALAFQPLALTRASGLGEAAFGAAGLGLALASAAALVHAGDDAPRRALRTGMLLGLAWLLGAPGAAVLASAAAACVLRGWRAPRAALDRLVAGLALVAGPWLAWTRFGPGAPAAAGDAGARLPVGEVVAHSVLAFGGQPLPAVAADGAVAAAFAIAALAAIAGGLAWLRRPAATRPEARVALLALAALLAAAFETWRRSRAGGRADVAVLLSAAPAAAALLAAGLAGLLAPGRAAALAGLLASAGLAWLAARHQAHVQGPAFFPPNRVHDAHLLCFDPLAQVPAPRRLATIPLLSPVDGLQLSSPPVVVWSPAADPDARYSVQLGLDGALPAGGTFESAGLALRERYPVPESLWQALPPGLELVLRVTRLPAVDEVFGGEGRPLLADQSPVVRVRRAPRPDEPPD